MKLLIVDDEEHVREGIELSLDWSHYQIDQILMAEHGMQAIQLVREHQPEIILCDMSMHIMDGPQFLQLLREEGWTSKVIVLSGYQEFHYTRATLLANGIDYLLKPFKISDLEHAIANAVSIIREEQEAHLQEITKNFQVNKSNQLINEQRFAQLIEDSEVSLQDLSVFLSNLSISPKKFYLVTFLLRNKDEIIKKQYRKDEQLFDFASLNIVRDFFSRNGKWYALKYEAFIVVFITTDLAASQMKLIISQLQEAWYKTIKLNCFLGFLPEAISVEQLQTTWLIEKSQILASHLNDSFMNKTKMPVDFKNPIHSFMDMEFAIIEAITHRNKSQLQELIQSFINEVISYPQLTLRDLQHYTIQINLLLVRIYEKLKDDRLHETIPLWISHIDEWSTKLLHLFLGIIDLITLNKIDITHMNSIVAVRNYINDHLAEDITLTGLAELFHFSPQYLAKRFKEEYNCTIMSYLTKQRMDKACSLLLHTHFSIQEIASQCGYVELNYFSKVFRKHTSSSPSSYRKKHLN